MCFRINRSLQLVKINSLILIYKNIDFPFLKKMNGPFAKAHKEIKILIKKNEKNNYVDSILILTNGFNKTFGKNINISNLNEFTEKNINYQLKNYQELLFHNSI